MLPDDVWRNSLDRGLATSPFDDHFYNGENPVELEHGQFYIVHYSHLKVVNKIRWQFIFNIETCQGTRNII